MPRVVGQTRLLVLVLALAWAGGCGDRAGGRLPISGSVTFKGQPLDDAVIDFVPLAEPSAGELYTKSGTDVRGGKYAIPKAQGLVPGKYKVLISAGVKQEATGEEAPGPSGGAKEASVDRLDKIPPEYNVRSKQIVEVKKEGPNEFDFAIP